MWSERIQRSWPFPSDCVESGGIRRPPGLGGAAVREEREHEHEAAEEEEPVRERVQARERDVPGSDHQRDEVVREAREDRDDDEEDHRRAVERDQLVVAVGAYDPAVLLHELEPDHQRADAGEQEEPERRPDVEDPDPLVVGRDEPARDAAALPGGNVRLVRLDSTGHSAGSPPGRRAELRSARRSTASRRRASRRGRSSRAPPAPRGS